MPLASGPAGPPPRPYCSPPGRAAGPGGKYADAGRNGTERPVRRRSRIGNEAFTSSQSSDTTRRSAVNAAPPAGAAIRLLKDWAQSVAGHRGRSLRCATALLECVRCSRAASASTHRRRRPDHPSAGQGHTRGRPAISLRVPAAPEEGHADRAARGRDPSAPGRSRTPPRSPTRTARWSSTTADRVRGQPLHPAVAAGLFLMGEFPAAVYRTATKTGRSCTQLSSSTVDTLYHRTDLLKAVGRRAVKTGPSWSTIRRSSHPGGRWGSIAMPAVGKYEGLTVNAVELSPARAVITDGRRSTSIRLRRKQG